MHPIQLIVITFICVVLAILLGIVFATAKHIVATNDIFQDFKNDEVDE